MRILMIIIFLNVVNTELKINMNLSTFQNDMIYNLILPITNFEFNENSLS